MDIFESIFYMAWRGIAIGLIISAPMGPVGMLCIQRTLDKGRRAGFYTGIGAALSDLFYSLLTGFGLSFIEDFLERNSNVIQLAGSAVLIAFGVYLFRKNPTQGLKKPVDDSISIKKSILGGFFFTFSNPLILFLIVGLFARFNFLLTDTMAHQQFSWIQYVIIYLVGYSSIFIGAILWWWFITFSISKVRNHFNLRSMWLINKIIGSIIMLFAIVGIFTATTALVNGANIRCWKGDTLVNDGSTGMNVLYGADKSDALEFRCKVRNLKPSGNWGFILTGTCGDRINIDFSRTEVEWDGISTAEALVVKSSVNGEEPQTARFTDNTNLINKLKSGMLGPDPSGRLNHFKISVFGDNLILFGGLHTPKALVSIPLPANFRCDSIGFSLEPGASIHPYELRLTSGSFRQEETPWTDSALLHDYLSSSRDYMEGYWQTIDRDLDESLLRLGGDYRYAAVKAEGGYDLLYISGARVNAAKWQPGMVKASLRPSGIAGVWDVKWIDAMFQPLSHELKAQMDGHGVITIQFPYQNSKIRLFHSEIAPLTPEGVSDR